MDILHLDKVVGTTADHYCAYLLPGSFANAYHVKTLGLKFLPYWRQIFIYSYYRLTGCSGQCYPPSQFEKLSFDPVLVWAASYRVMPRPSGSILAEPPCH